MPTATFRIPGRFHPPSAPLGRWLERRLEDPLRAEAWYLFAVGCGAVLLLLVQFFTWALWAAPSAADTGPPGAFFFWAVQIGLTGLFAAAALVGFEPAYEIRIEADRLRVLSEADTFELPLSAIVRTERVPARTYHRHHRKYRRTRDFVNRPGESVLLLWTTDGPVGLGLEVGDQTELCRILSERHSRRPAEQLSC